MSKIKIDPNEYGSSIMSYKSLQFSLLSAPKHGSKQVCSWSCCRDYLHDTYRGWLHPDSGGARTAMSVIRRRDDKSVPDIKKLRLLIASLDETPYGLSTQEALFVGKRMLNIYEEFLGFSKSTITTVAYPLPKGLFGKNVTVWLFSGSKEWIKSPHLLSIVTLILRVAYRLRKLPVFKDNSMQEVDEVLRDFHATSVQCSDTTYVKRVVAALPVVLAHHNELFTHPMSEAYERDAYNFHSRGGIVSLCDYNSPLTDLNAKVKKLLAGGDK